MAQSALTVTPPNPTPPTNFACTGVTGPNPPNYRRSHYANPFNLDANGKPQTPYGVNPNPPPYFDDGVAAAGTAFIAPTAALAGGTSAADDAGTAPGFNGTTVAAAGGTGVNQTSGTYPVAGGLVPASSSAVHEGAGTEVVVTQTYRAGETPAVGALQWIGSTGPAATQATRDAGPNATHASTMSPTTNPALVSIAPTTLAAATTGTQLITCTGTGFVPGCRIWHDGVEQSTTFVGATSLTALVKKRPFAGIAPVVVKLGGVQMGVSAPFTWT
jgi:hypothetical protein